MADLYYIEEGYWDPSLGYYVYTADAAAAISAASSLSCDAAILVAPQEAAAAITSTFTQTADAFRTQTAQSNVSSAFTQTTSIERIVSSAVSVNAAFTQTASVGKLLSAVIDCGALFTPGITADAFKNHTAILDVVFTTTTVGVANRSATMAVDNIANLNAQAAKTVDVNSAFTNTATQTAQVSKLVDTSSTLQTESTLAVDAISVQLASAAFATTSSLFTTRYFGRPRPRDLIDVQGSTFSSSVVKFGSHSATGRGDLTGLSERAKGTIPKQTEDFVFETWYRKGTGILRNLVSWTTLGPTANAFFRLSWQLNNTIQLRLYFATNGTYDITSGQIADNTWYHLLIVKNNSLVSFYVNGTRVGTFDWTYEGGMWTWTGSGNPSSVSMIVNATNHYLDETSLHLGTNLGYSPSSTTITVPTAARVNDATTTAFLYHFDGNNSDDITVSQIGAAALTSQFALSASAQELSSAQATLSSTSTVSASIVVNKSADSALSTATALAATATRIQEGASTLSSEFTIDAKGHVKRNIVDADFPPAVFTQTANADRTRTAEIVIESAFTPTLVVDAFKNMTAILDSVASLTAQATTSVDSSSALTSTATLSSDLTRIRTVDSTITSSAELAATVFRTQDNQAAITASATLSVVVGQEEQAEAAITSASTLTANAVKTATGAATASTAFTQAVSVERTRSTLVAVSSQFTQTALAVKIHPGAAAFTATASLTALAVKTTDIVASAAAEFTQTATVNRTVNPGLAFTSIATQLTVAFQNATGTVSLESTATLTALVGKIIEYPENGITGIHCDSAGLNFAELVDTDIYTSQTGLVMSIWARKDNTSVSQAPFWSTDIASGSGVRFEFVDQTTARFVVVNVGNATYFAWPSGVVIDTEWHQYVLHIKRRYTDGNSFPNTQMDLYRDGAFVGSSDIRVFPSWGIFGNLNLGQSPSVPSEFLSAKYLDGDLAQIWIGSLGSQQTSDAFGPIFTSNAFNINNFYNQGAIDLGTDGTNSGFLPTPWFYSPITQPYSDITYYDDSSIVSAQPALEVLGLPDMQARASMTVSIVGVALFVATLPAATSMSVLGARIRTGTATANAVAQVQAQAQGNFGLSADLTATTEQTTLGDRFRTAAAAFTASSQITAEQGFLKDFAVTMTASSTLACEPTEIEAIQGAAALTTAATVTATVIRLKVFGASLAATSTISADVTVIPPIRASANLTATTTLTAVVGGRVNVIALTVAAATLTVNPVVTRSASAQLTAAVSTEIITNKRTGIPLTNLQVNGFTLTAGDIINLEPSLIYVIPEETRVLLILKESRELAVEQETRQLTLLEG